MTSSAALRWRRSWRAARLERSATWTLPPIRRNRPTASATSRAGTAGGGGGGGGAAGAGEEEPIWHGGAVVGWVTSGAYAHYSRRSLAFGYVPSELAVPGAMFEVEIIGQRRPARLLSEPVLDPAGHRMRV